MTPFATSSSLGVSNGLVFTNNYEHASSALFLGAKAAIKLSCEQRALLKIQMANSEYFVIFPMAATSLLNLKKKLFCAK